MSSILNKNDDMSAAITNAASDFIVSQLAPRELIKKQNEALRTLKTDYERVVSGSDEVTKGLIRMVRLLSQSAAEENEKRHSMEIREIPSVTTGVLNSNNPKLYLQYINSYLKAVKDNSSAKGRFLSIIFNEENNVSEEEEEFDRIMLGAQKKNDHALDIEEVAPSVTVSRPKTPELSVGSGITGNGISHMPLSPPESTRSTESRPAKTGKPSTTTLADAVKTTSSSLGEALTKASKSSKPRKSDASSPSK